MEQLFDRLLEIREYIKIYVGRYENIAKPAGKFLLAFIALSVINGNVGFASRLTSVAVTLIVALLASFLPLNFIPVISAMFILLHMYSLSLECLIVVGVLFVLMFMLYFRFSPKDSILAVSTPILYVLKIPYVMPLAAGLVAPPSAMVSTGCGVIIRYVLRFFIDNQETIRGMSEDEILVKLKFILDGILFNKEMYVAAMAFAITIAVVSIVRRVEIDHSWTIAIVSGALTDIVVILLGDLKFGTYIPIGTLLISSIVGIAVAYIIKFFLFNLDYSKTEKVQFEDDEYYYYVKAVPKNLFDMEKKKKISGSDEIKSSRESINTKKAAYDNVAASYEPRRRSRGTETGEKLGGLERAAAEKARRTRTEQKNRK